LSFFSIQPSYLGISVLRILVLHTELETPLYLSTERWDIVRKIPLHKYMQLYYIRHCDSSTVKFTDIAHARNKYSYRRIFIGQVHEKVWQSLRCILCRNPSTETNKTNSRIRQKNPWNEQNISMNWTKQTQEMNKSNPRNNQS